MTSALQSIFNNELSLEITSISRLSGGDINDVFLVNTPKGLFCIKINLSDRYPDMLRKEQEGLAEIDSVGAIRTPQAYNSGVYEKYQYLILEYIEQSGITDRKFWECFGLELAELHQNSYSSHGFRHDNYIGSLAQKNTNQDLWSTFFIENRLTPLVKIAKDNELLDQTTVALFEAVYTKIPGLFDEESPALLHGDLWSGNYLKTTKGPVLIDPAVYFGNREADIAMMHLFGGFDKRLFDTYNEYFPLQDGWKHRLDIWNLYPLLVHLNLFGKAYFSQIHSVLKNFV